MIAPPFSWPHAAIEFTGKWDRSNKNPVELDRLNSELYSLKPNKSNEHLIINMKEQPVCLWRNGRVLVTSGNKQHHRIA